MCSLGDYIVGGNALAREAFHEHHVSVALGTSIECQTQGSAWYDTTERIGMSHSVSDVFKVTDRGTCPSRSATVRWLSVRAATLLLLQLQ